MNYAFCVSKHSPFSYYYCHAYDIALLYTNSNVFSYNAVLAENRTHCHSKPKCIRYMLRYSRGWKTAQKIIILVNIPFSLHRVIMNLMMSYMNVNSMCVCVYHNVVVMCVCVHVCVYVCVCDGYLSSLCVLTHHNFLSSLRINIHTYTLQRDTFIVKCRIKIHLSHTF